MGEACTRRGLPSRRQFQGVLSPSPTCIRSKSTPTQGASPHSSSLQVVLHPREVLHFPNQSRPLGCIWSFVLVAVLWWTSFYRHHFVQGWVFPEPKAPEVASRSKSVRLCGSNGCCLMAPSPLRTCGTCFPGLPPSPACRAYQSFVSSYLDRWKIVFIQFYQWGFSFLRAIFTFFFFTDL